MPVVFLIGFLAFGALPAAIIETQPDYPAQVHAEQPYHQIVDGHDTIRSDG